MRRVWDGGAAVEGMPGVGAGGGSQVGGNVTGVDDDNGGRVAPRR